ncbi:MAG TPA: hypothetical protein VJ249_01220 [Candidatus Bathyarchaeia archaeon]|nr:hypothetical protein [Candidatus Bathyarchaeia archaeon]
MAMLNPLKRVLSRFGEALTHRTALFLTTTEKVMGVSPDISFKTMSKVYLGDLAARASVDFLADQIAGAGFYTTMNTGYVEKSDGRTGKELVDEFCAEQGIDEVLQESARYLVGWGNVFWWTGNAKRIEFVRLLPLEIVKDNGVKFDADGHLDRIELDWKRQPSEIQGDEVIHLAYNVLTAKPLGIGVLQSLCTPLDIGNGETREAFYQIKAKIHSGMADTIYMFGAPNELWSFPGLSKERLQEFFAQIKSIPQRGSRFVFNPPAGSEAKVQPIVAERMRGLDFYVETLQDEFILGLQTPLAKLVTKTGFTEASAKAALAIAERRVQAVQRFLKRGVERYLFDTVVAQAGLDPAQARVRLNWGMPESLDYEKLVQLLGHLVSIIEKVGGDVITVQELRKILRDVAKLPLDEQEVIVQSKVGG